MIEPDYTLTSDQRKKFCDALMDAFRTPKQLEMMLCFESSLNLSQIAAGDNYEEIVFDLINWAESKGKIKELLDAARRRNPGNLKLYKLSSTYANNVTAKFLETLKNILSKIDFHLVINAYKKTLPNNSIKDTIQLNNPKFIDDIIQILLTDYPIADNEIPSVVEFVRQVKYQTRRNHHIYEELVDWLNNICTELNIKIQSDSKAKFREVQSYLFVIVYPEGDQFRLEAEYILDETQGIKSETLDLQELLNQFDTVHDSVKGILCDSFEKIPEHLSKIIEYFLYCFSDEISKKPIVEVFLPYKYLGQNLDEKWRIKDDFDDDIPIVKEFDMILHPIERMIPGKIIFLNLKEGWNNLLDTLNATHNQDTLVSKVELISKIDNRNQDKIANTLKKQIGLKLTEPLSEKSSDQEIFFKTVMRGGIPFAFWRRFQTPSHLQLEEIDCHLTGNCLNNNLQILIKEICYIRRHAYAQKPPENHLGYHLGFLCDNPYRIPKIKPLKGF